MTAKKQYGRLAVLDEVVSGRVTTVEGNTVTLITTKGPSLHYRAKDLVKMEEDITVSAFEVAQAKAEYQKYGSGTTEVYIPPKG